jgi:hypothetical protein
MRQEQVEGLFVFIENDLRYVHRTTYVTFNYNIGVINFIERFIKFRLTLYCRANLSY